MKSKIISNILFILFFLLIGYFVNKFYSTPNPTDKLLLSKYPDAKNIKWRSYTYGYYAGFDIGIKHYESFFDKDKVWKETATEITEKELPPIVRPSPWQVCYKREIVETAFGETLYRLHIYPNKKRSQGYLIRTFTSRGFEKK